jgi:hypothetical protein
MPRTLLALSIVMLMTLSARGREDDPVRVKLDKAKAAYATELEKFEKDIGAYFDKREESARKSGDKKSLDLVKVERTAFEERSELPASAPRAAKLRLATARTAMEKAYATAVKEYTMAKKDDAAAGIEKELTAFKQQPDPTDARRQWVHAKGTFTSVGKGEWEEKSPDGTTYKWKETARTRDYVELQANIFNVDYTVRLTARSADYSSGGGDFKPKFAGKWAN